MRYIQDILLVNVYELRVYELRVYKLLVYELLVYESLIAWEQAAIRSPRGNSNHHQPTVRVAYLPTDNEI